MAKRNLKKLRTVDLQAEIERRRRQIPALMDQRKRLLSELRTVEKQIDALGAGQSNARSRGFLQTAAKDGSRRRAKNKVPLGDMIVSILPKDQPMKVADIVDQVVARGYQTTSSNFSTIVNQALIKDKRFQQATRGYYTLAKSDAAP